MSMLWSVLMLVRGIDGRTIDGRTKDVVPGAIRKKKFPVCLVLSGPVKVLIPSSLV